MRTAIETHPTGRYFDFVAPTAEQIDVRDIACALSNTCRFGGHVSRFYSVAEHAVRASWWVRDRGYSRGAQLAALHHDSHEAYLGDIPTPLKKRIGPLYTRLAEEIDALIGEVIGVVLPLYCPSTKKADDYMLRVEAGQLKKSRGIGSQWPWGAAEALHTDERLGWYPREAEGMFMSLHRRLVAMAVSL